MPSQVDASFSEASSWAEGLVRYRDAKANLPYEQPPVKFETHKEKSHTAYYRGLNPIRGAYNDAQLDATIVEEERKTFVKRMNEAYDRSLKSEGNYNIINHVDKKRGLAEEPHSDRNRPSLAPLHRPAAGGTRHEYNIISNQDADKHFGGQKPAVVEQKKRRGKKTGIAPNFAARDYGIVSNRYMREHTPRQERETQAALDAAASVFWGTRDYDPIRGTFYNPDKESDFQKFRTIQETEHGKDHLSKFPPSIRAAPSQAYNITTFSVRDRASYDALERQTQKGDHRFQLRKLQNTSHLGSGMSVTLMANEKEYASRIAPERFSLPIERGYDIVTNERYGGLAGKPIHPTDTLHRTTLWERIGEDQTKDGEGPTPLACVETEPVTDVAVSSEGHQNSRRSSRPTSVPRLPLTPGQHRSPGQQSLQVHSPLTHLSGRPATRDGSGRRVGGVSEGALTLSGRVRPQTSRAGEILTEKRVLESKAGPVVAGTDLRAYQLRPYTPRTPASMRDEVGNLTSRPHTAEACDTHTPRHRLTPRDEVLGPMMGSRPRTADTGVLTSRSAAERTKHLSAATQEPSVGPDALQPVRVQVHALNPPSRPAASSATASPRAAFGSPEPAPQPNGLASGRKPPQAIVASKFISPAEAPPSLAMVPPREDIMNVETPKSLGSSRRVRSGPFQRIDAKEAALAED